MSHNKNHSYSKNGVLLDSGIVKLSMIKAPQSNEVSTCEQYASSKPPIFVQHNKNLKTDFRKVLQQKMLL